MALCLCASTALCRGAEEENMLEEVSLSLCRRAVLSSADLCVRVQNKRYPPLELYCPWGPKVRTHLILRPPNSDSTGSN